MDVELTVVEPVLHAVDGLRGELLVGALCEDERPPRGVAGLVDWRLTGGLTRHCLSGYLTGAVGEQFLITSKPRLAFDRVLVVGLGPTAELDANRCLSLIDRLASTIAGMRVRRVALELPGRHLQVPSALDAIGRWLDALMVQQGVLETVTLIDDRGALAALEEARRKRGRRLRIRPRQREDAGKDERSR